MEATKEQTTENTQDSFSEPILVLESDMPREGVEAAVDRAILFADQIGDDDIVQYAVDAVCDCGFHGVWLPAAIESLGAKVLTQVRDRGRLRRIVAFRCFARIPDSGPQTLYAAIHIAAMSAFDSVLEECVADREVVAIGG